MHNVRYRALAVASAHSDTATTVLLPRPDAGWRNLVRQTHLDNVSGHATAHGISPIEYRRAAHLQLRQWTAHAEVRVRVGFDVLPIFLRDGRYKTQFESQTSRGVLHPSRRALVEHTVLGVPVAARPRDRPIYGYLEGTDELGLIRQYGDVVLRLRTHIRARTTFTFGDTLDASTALSPAPPFAPSPLLRPDVLSLDSTRDVLASALAREAVDPRYGYIEAQIHGGVRPSDVYEAVFTLNIVPDPPMQDAMLRLGLHWRTVSGDLP